MYSQRIEYQKVQNTSPKKAQDTTFHNVRHFNEQSQSKVKYKSENSQMACGIWCKIQRIKDSILQHLIERDMDRINERHFFLATPNLLPLQYKYINKSITSEHISN